MLKEHRNTVVIFVISVLSVDNNDNNNDDNGNKSTLDVGFNQSLQH